MDELPEEVSAAAVLDEFGPDTLQVGLEAPWAPPNSEAQLSGFGATTLLSYGIRHAVGCERFSDSVERTAISSSGRPPAGTAD